MKHRGLSRAIMFCLLTTPFTLLCFGPIHSTTASLVIGRGPFRDAIYEELSPSVLKDQAYNQEDEEIMKRSAFGLLGLATKRPHKMESDLNHPPPPDAFMSVRGRKRSVFVHRSPFQNIHAPIFHVWKTYAPF